MKVKKGDWGYLQKRPTILLCYVLITLLASSCVYLTGYFINKDPKNILTVVAVLGMLPVAKLMTSAIMYFKARKYACPKQFQNKVLEISKELEPTDYAYDLYLTSYDKNFPLCFAFAAKGSIIGWMPVCKHQTRDAEKHIEEYLSKNNVSNINVKIFENEAKFLERFEKICTEPIDENDRHALSIVKSLAL